MLAESRDCSKCPLRGGCGQVVWGAGPADARLLLVGETPGAEEDLMGEPFVSRDGRLLTRLLSDAGIARDRCYLTYAVKCDPGRTAVTDDHVNACRGWLWQELKRVDPKVVVTLGKLPARLLLGLKKSFKMGDVAGEFRPVAYMGAVVAPWYSPNHVLQRGRAADAEAVEFFKRVKEQLDA